MRDVIRDWDVGERLGSGGSSNGAGGKKNLLSIIRLMPDNRVLLDLFFGVILCLFEFDNELPLFSYVFFLWLANIFLIGVCSPLSLFLY